MHEQTPNHRHKGPRALLAIVLLLAFTHTLGCHFSPSQAAKTLTDAAVTQGLETSAEEGNLQTIHDILADPTIKKTIEEVATSAARGVIPLVKSQVLGRGVDINLRSATPRIVEAVSQSVARVIEDHLIAAAAQSTEAVVLTANKESLVQAFDHISRTVVHGGTEELISVIEKDLLQRYDSRSPALDLRITEKLTWLKQILAALGIAIGALVVFLVVSVGLIVIRLKQIARELRLANQQTAELGSPGDHFATVAHSRWSPPKARAEVVE